MEVKIGVIVPSEKRGGACRARARVLIWPSTIRDSMHMFLVGLTGNIGSGKSTVAQLLSERGATIIDADVLARRAVEVGTAAYAGIVERWGTSILGADGMIDRGALRRIVFSDQQQLEQLNLIVHPEVERMRASLVELARQRGDRLVVCDIPLLFERRMTEAFDRIVLVDAPRPVRLERLVRERGLRETEAMDMIVAQMPAELKRARADFVIDNDGTLTQLDLRVSEVWSALLAAAEATETASV
jgi:dephospho-CoA kinase